MRDEPTLVEIAAPIAAGLLAAGAPCNPATAGEALVFAALLRDLADEIEPAQLGDDPAVPCPQCKSSEHQAQARAGEWVCGDCGHNYEGEAHEA